LRVAFVAPFYGTEASGGAESECRQTALHLAASGVEVEVLTTCLLDLQHDWNVNVHPEGTTRDEGVTVRRFRAEPFDPLVFGPLNRHLIAGETLSPDDERAFAAMHINSFPLYRHLAAARERYDRVFFIPYLFGTTFHGTMLCGDRGVLIPCLHDEGYARMGIVREMFERVGGIVFHTVAERELARRLYGEAAAKGVVLGEGVEMEFPSDGDRFRRTHGIDGPFLLYAGRKDPTKNVDALIRWFAAYDRRSPGRLKLVMIGPGSLPLPAGAAGSILDLGFVSLQEKRDACSAALGLCQPSVNESFSIVMMEAWSRGIPCLVHEECAVTREHVVTSGGGLYFRDEGDFGALLDYLLANPEMALRMGRAGREYAVGRFSWETVIRRYRTELLDLV
jgi:glycosyltransferase involved in cell wall biosynthesis